MEYEPLQCRMVSRRCVFAGVATVASAAVAGCATYGQPAGASAPSPDGGGDTAAPERGGGNDGAALAKASDVPVGGGGIFADQQVVVTQPAQGSFRAFATTCTHAGCTVDEVAGGTINCPCHGSKFAIADGSVVAGPAPRPLPQRRITVEDGAIRIA